MDTEQAWQTFRKTYAFRKASVADKLDTIAAQLNEIQTDVAAIPEIKEAVDGDENAMGQQEDDNGGGSAPLAGAGDALGALLGGGGAGGAPPSPGGGQGGGEQGPEEGSAPVAASFDKAEDDDEDDDDDDDEDDPMTDDEDEGENFDGAGPNAPTDGAPDAGAPMDGPAPAGDAPSGPEGEFVDPSAPPTDKAEEIADMAKQMMSEASDDKEIDAIANILKGVNALKNAKAASAEKKQAASAAKSDDGGAQVAKPGKALDPAPVDKDVGGSAKAPGLKTDAPKADPLKNEKGSNSFTACGDTVDMKKSEKNGVRYTPEDADAERVNVSHKKVIPKENVAAGKGQSDEGKKKSFARPRASATGKGKAEKPSVGPTEPPEPSKSPAKTEKFGSRGNSSKMPAMSELMKSVRAADYWRVGEQREKEPWQVIMDEAKIAKSKGCCDSVDKGDDKAPEAPEAPKGDAPAADGPDPLADDTPEAPADDEDALTGAPQDDYPSDEEMDDMAADYGEGSEPAGNPFEGVPPEKAIEMLRQAYPDDERIEHIADEYTSGEVDKEMAMGMEGDDHDMTPGDEGEAAEGGEEPSGDDDDDGDSQFVDMKDHPFEDEGDDYGSREKSPDEGNDPWVEDEDEDEDGSESDDYGSREKSPDEDSEDSEDEGSEDDDYGSREKDDSEKDDSEKDDSKDSKKDDDTVDKSKDSKKDDFPPKKKKSSSKKDDDDGSDDKDDKDDDEKEKKDDGKGPKDKGKDLPPFLKKDDKKKDDSKDSKKDGGVKKSVSSADAGGKVMRSMADTIAMFKSEGRPLTRPTADVSVNGEQTRPELGRISKSADSAPVRMGHGVDPAKVVEKDWEDYNLFMRTKGY